MSVHVCLFASAVCDCVYIRDHISGTTHPNFTKLSAYVARGRSLALLWRRSDILRTSGLADHITITYFRNGPRVALVDTVATTPISQGFQCLLYVLYFGCYYNAPPP